MTGLRVSVTEFTAKCSAYLDEVERHGRSITITRRGRPVAVLSRAKQARWKSPANSWAGKIEIVGDIVSDMADLWDRARKDQE